MSTTRHAFETWSIGRKLAYGYAAWAVVLLIVVGLRAGTLEAWFWRAGLLSMLLAVSLRSALIYTHRDTPSRLNWWIRPSPGERNFAVTWLVYAVFFGAASLLILFV